LLQDTVDEFAHVSRDLEEARGRCCFLEEEHENERVHVSREGEELHGEFVRGQLVLQRAREMKWECERGVERGLLQVDLCIYINMYIHICF